MSVVAVVCSRDRGSCARDGVIAGRCQPPRAVTTVTALGRWLHPSLVKALSGEALPGRISPGGRFPSNGARPAAASLATRLTTTQPWSTASCHGEAKNARGDKRTARIKTANGYSLTVTGALAVAEHLLANDVPGGAYTPARLIGSDLLTRLPGSGPLQMA